MERTAYHLRDAGRIVDLGDPFGHLTEHAAVIDFLEGFALGHIAADLTDEQYQRSRILMSGVYSDRGVRCAWPAGDEGDTGFASHLAPGIGHVGDAAFLSAYEFDLVMDVEHIERREKFPGTQNTVSTPQQTIDQICPPVRVEEEPSGMLFVLSQKVIIRACPSKIVTVRPTT